MRRILVYQFEGRWCILDPDNAVWEMPNDRNGEAQALLAAKQVAGTLGGKWAERVFTEPQLFYRLDEIEAPSP